MPTASDFVNADFEIAKRRFKESVGDPDIYDRVLQTTGSDEVTKLIKKAQEDAASSLGMRGMGRLEPFILRLKDFACVFDTYVQIKPDLLALIWGPIRLLLLWSSEFYETVDSVVDATEMIAQALPRFASMASLFNENQAVRSVHVLFLQDILDFYAAVLKFFGKWCSPARGLLARVRNKVIEKADKAFEIAWAAKKKELRVVVENLENHARLLKNEVTFLQIEEAKKARDEALVKSTKDDEEQETRKFHGLRSRIAPVLYDKELDVLSNKCHSGGVNWLLRDPKFNHWLDVSKRDSTWLWLHGILGAGKTYLAAAAINHVKKSNQVLFAFAGQANPDETALSSIQTLIFQAATDNAAFRTVLVEASERELQGNTTYAANLLKSLLMSAGPAYIIIDGLDEIKEIERQILLQKLEMICKVCKELKILISSRDVHDIEQVLKLKAKDIRVDQKNHGAIQTYINDRLGEWMDEHCDDTDSRSEIVRLLADLSAYAQGMFLYARIMMDLLGDLHGIEEIRREFRCLPTELNEAYERIFNRIKRINPNNQNKCRNIFLWIACSPTRLTALELEQVILLGTNAGEALPSAISLNLVRLCGPIIEVIDGWPQFIHVTAKSHFLTKELNNSIEAKQAQLKMALRGLSYLSSQDLSVELSDLDIERNLLSGKYRLLEYFASNWHTLALTIVRDIDDNNIYPKFNRMLTDLARQAENDQYEDEADSPRPPYMNRTLAINSPEGHNMLGASLRFRHNEKVPDWNRTESHDWVDLDPLTTSKMLVRVQKLFNDLVCSRAFHNADCGGQCAKLQRNYGGRLYRCHFVFCESNRLGFESDIDRWNHYLCHYRPWKCTNAACEFRNIGFTSKKNRETHWLERHMREETQPGDLDGLEKDEIQPLLFRLVADEDIDGIKRLLALPVCESLGSTIRTVASLIAVEKGSYPMVRLLIPEDWKHLHTDLVIAAVKSGDVDIVKWALQKSNPGDLSKLVVPMLKTSSTEAFFYFKDYLLTIRAPMSGVNPLEALFKATVIGETKIGTTEDRLKEIWEHLFRNDRVKQKTLSASLVNVAKSTFSIPLARTLIKFGADVDYPKGPSENTSSGMSALRYAARKPISSETAKFMKFLLENGACPFEKATKGNSRSVLSFFKRGVYGETPFTPSTNTDKLISRKHGYINLADCEGAKNIWRELGETWEELAKRNAKIWMEAEETRLK